MAKKNRAQELIDILSREGQKIVDRQLANVGYTNRTYNLHDSYGWGVYLNGELKASGFPAAQATKARTIHGKTVKGREAVEDFLKNKYVPHPGIDLVVVEAMPYGEEVEVEYKYEVIATARDGLKQLSSKFNNSTYGIIKNGSY